MFSGGDKTGNVGDVHHHQRSGLLCDRGYTLEIDNPWIRAGAHNDQLWLVFTGEAREFVIVDLFGVSANSVGNDPIVLP